MDNLQCLIQKYNQLASLYRQLCLIEFNSGKGNVYYKQRDKIANQKDDIEKFIKENISSSLAIFLCDAYPYSHSSSYPEVFLARKLFQSKEAAYERLSLFAQEELQTKLSHKLAFSSRDELKYFDFVLGKTFIETTNLFMAKVKNMEYIMLKNHLFYTIPFLEPKVYENILADEKDLILKARIPYYEYALYKRDSIEAELKRFFLMFNSLKPKEALKACQSVSFSLYFITLIALLDQTILTNNLLYANVNDELHRNLLLEIIDSNRAVLAKIKTK